MLVIIWELIKYYNILHKFQCICFIWNKMHLAFRFALGSYPNLIGFWKGLLRTEIKFAIGSVRLVATTNLKMASVHPHYLFNFVWTLFVLFTFIDYTCALFLLWKSHRGQMECLFRAPREGYEWRVGFWGSSHGLTCLTPMGCSDALDELQLKRYCCRRMVLTHVDLIEKLLHYNRAFVVSVVCPRLTNFCLLIAMERTKDKTQF